MQIKAFFSRHPLALLRAVVIAGFAVILSGVAFAIVQFDEISEIKSRIMDLRQSAYRLNALSKDLLITENFMQTFDDWKITRKRLMNDYSDMLVDQRFRGRLAPAEARRQVDSSVTLLNAITPEMDGIEVKALQIKDSTSEFIPGLYAAKLQYPDVPMDSAISDIRNFSLYIGDVLNLRLADLNEAISQAASITTRVTGSIMSAIALAVLALILAVIRSLGLYQAKVREANVYLEGILSQIYDISGQGFLTFDRDLAVDSSISKMSSQILGRDPSGLKITEVLWKDEMNRSDFSAGSELIFSGKAKPEVIFDLFGHETVINDRYIALNFRYLPGNKILLALTDVTREHELKKLVEDRENSRSIVLSAVTRRQYFHSFTEEAARLFTELHQSMAAPPGEKALEGLKRHIHTFKGNAAFFSFKRSAEEAHGFEEHIGDNLIMGGDIKLAERTEALEGAYYAELSNITGILGPSWLDELDSVMVPRMAYLKIERYVRAKYPQDNALYSNLVSHRRLPFSELFDRFPEMAEGLAEKLGKRLAPISVVGGDFPVLPERYEGLVSNLAHLVRNMVDHGIETAQEREEAGKPPQGEITIELERDGQFTRIHMADDGRGISSQAVLSRAIERGLIPAGTKLSREETLELLFKSGFSTASDISEVSGRGVGMGAVRDAVAALGGTITLQSEEGRGTSYVIEIPHRKAGS
jgi:two-component system chemotaxis sensor kinase CheA